MLINTVAGPAASTSDGTQLAMRSGKLGDAIVSELHGRYYEQTYRRNIFSVANQTGIATTVGAALAYTGLSLSDPLGSGVNLVLLKVSATFPVPPAATTVIGVMVGYNAGTNVTHTTPATPRSNFVGVGATGLGLADTSCTFPTAPTLQTVLGSIKTGGTVVSVDPILPLDLEGSIILPPGAYAAFFTSTVSGALGFLGSITYEEVLA